MIVAAMSLTGCTGGSRKPWPFPVSPIEQRLSVVAKKYEFVPATLKVRKDRKVVMRIRSVDNLSYGVYIPELGLRTTVPAGGESEIRFVPKRKGMFGIRCGPPARGPGCDNMRGTIEVK